MWVGKGKGAMAGRMWVGKGKGYNGGTDVGGEGKSCNRTHVVNPIPTQNCTDRDFSSH